MGKIFDHIKPTVAPEGNDAGLVELGIKQVLAVRRGLHEGFRGFLGAEVVGYVFARMVVVNS
jgi:hypothetical protein